MLAKKKRLTTEAFNRFFSSGKRISSQHLQLIFNPFPNFHGSVVVGKKVFKSAVKRNQLRRQLYNTLYRHQPTSGVFIVLVKPAAKNTDIATLREELLSVLGKIEPKVKSR